MNEKIILQISVAVIILGLGFLFIYAQELDLKVIPRVEDALPSQAITLTGTIDQLKPQGKAIFIKLTGSTVTKTDVILFTDEDIFLHPGDYVEVSGTVEEFNGKKEVIGNKVVLKGNQK